MISSRNGQKYRCKITPSSGSAIYTEEVAMTLGSSTSGIIEHPAHCIVDAGGIATFSVQVTDPRLTYQWQYKLVNNTS